ncbi:MAG: sugar MFS transporter [Bacteroidetes bacterium]|nr:sugar MFS transporter [Bacteroidota bacterium]
MSSRINLRTLFPVMLSFFVMSFVDMVGIGVDRVKADMNLSDTMAQLIPSAAFLWFLILSVPVGIIQSRIGKKLMLNIGMAVTAAGMLVPFLVYRFPMVLAGFALLGIGNTIVQVSANPLLVDVVPGNRTSSFLSFSQFIKAIGSMVAPPLAAFFASRFGDWKILFLAFGIVSVLSVLWLGMIKVDESPAVVKATLQTTLKLLGNRFVLMMVLSIFIVVGVDVGFNSNSGQFLMHRYGFLQEAAESGRSIYFLGRMAGTFAGALLLTRITSERFYISTSVLGIISFLAILILPSSVNQFTVWLLVFITGLAVANIFPLVFSVAVRAYPERSSEISGLMMMAISGGAVFPPLMGLITQASNVTWGMSVMLFCMIFLLGSAIYTARR